MTDDIIERAEALNPDNYYAWRDSKATMFPDLLAALKAARVENERLERIRQLHSPVSIPEGKRHMVFEEGQTPCAGCSTGDPFLDDPWPCKTRRIADGRD